MIQVLKPLELVRVDIYVLKSYVSRLTWALARLHLVHLVDVRAWVAAGHPLTTWEQTETAEQRYAAIMERAKRLMESVGLHYEPLGLDVEGVSTDEIETLDQQLDTLEHALTALVERSRRLSAQASVASKTSRLLQLLAEAKTDPAALTKSKRLVIKVGLLPATHVAAVEEQISTFPHFFQQLGEVNGAKAVMTATLANDREKLGDFLKQADFEEFPNPDAPIEAAAQAAAKRESELVAELHTVLETLRRAASQAQTALGTIRRKAEIAGGLTKAQRRFATVGHTMIISGWVPKQSLDEVRRVVEQYAPGAAYLEVVDPSELRQAAGEVLRIPVLFNNPLLLKPFERITAAYGIPRYNEVEPTAFLAVSFLIMFGVMFGDLGQGLILALVGYLIFRTSLRYTDAGVLLVECGLSSAVFGCLYGSVFGAENIIPALWFHPMRDISTSMAVALIFGAVLISIGLILNVINSLRIGDMSAAVFGEHGLVGAFMYWVCLAVGTKFLLTGEVGLTGSALALLIGLPALTILFRRPIEEIFRRQPAKRPAWRNISGLFLESLVNLGDTFLSYLANTVSFIRLSAFSLAHIGLFVAIFALAESLSQVPGGGIWYWLTLILGNVVIIMLEGLVASIQAIRLEYYELFSKFFKGGGEPFRPLEV